MHLDKELPEAARSLPDPAQCGRTFNAPRAYSRAKTFLPSLTLYVLAYEKPLRILANMIIWLSSDSLNGTSTITPGARKDFEFCSGGSWEDNEMEW